MDIITFTTEVVKELNSEWRYTPSNEVRQIIEGYDERLALRFTPQERVTIEASCAIDADGNDNWNRTCGITMSNTLSMAEIAQEVKKELRWYQEQFNTAHNGVFRQKVLKQAEALRWVGIPCQHSL